ncbi:hypothetical protein TNCV_5024851 [Trichonephila clavipes]|nr:hypothetical protein TNCV_5024851 [Trichonephila clavipes]
MYELCRKQQNIMIEIENAKQEWAMDQTVILSTKLNKMKEKNDLIQRENDILKQENDVLKTKQELNSKLQGMSRKNKILKRCANNSFTFSKSPDPSTKKTHVKKIDSVIHRSPRSRERRNEERWNEERRPRDPRLYHRPYFRPPYQRPRVFRRPPLCTAIDDPLKSCRAPQSGEGVYLGVVGDVRWEYLLLVGPPKE